MEGVKGSSGDARASTYQSTMMRTKEVPGTSVLVDTEDKDRSRETGVEVQAGLNLWVRGSDRGYIQVRIKLEYRVVL